MSSIDTSSEGGGGGHKKGPGVKKQKRMSTNVDMTPLVDLGFLLITFFIFTTTMAQPTAMGLILPKDTEKEDEQNKVKESGAFTILMGGDNQVYFYEGLDPAALESSTYKDIRKQLLEKKMSTNPEDLVVIIKPTPDATYENTVDILDEMAICEIKRYAMVDATDNEYELVQKTALGGE